jgi:hypothetical protein
MQRGWGKDNNQMAAKPMSLNLQIPLVGTIHISSSLYHHPANPLNLRPITFGHHFLPWSIPQRQYLPHPFFAKRHMGARPSAA